MKHPPLSPDLFTAHRANLAKLLEKNSLAALNANDVMPTNADGTLGFHQNADLFYLTGIDQEETVLLLAPDAFDEKMQEILFVRQPNENLATWEGHKVSKEEATGISGIKNVKWLSDFRGVFHQLMCECEHVYLNSNEHKRAAIEVETRDARFVAEVQRRYPLHDYRRLARLVHRLRIVKSEPEIEVIKKACAITGGAFGRVLTFVKPGVNEAEIEAEFSHDFIRKHARFAYPPIIASGKNNCVMHYMKNDQACTKGQLLLLDVAARFSYYNSDLTRTIPVGGRFSRRQKRVYNAVLRILRETISRMTPGKLPKDLQKECEAFTEKELVYLGLLTMKEIKRQDPDKPALKKYFMHGVAHPLGLDVHDVGFTTEPIQPGWVLTCEPGIYIPEEGFGVRLENDILVTESGNIDLMTDVPIEAEEIEERMGR